MSDPRNTHTNTTVRESHTEKSKGGMGLIVGALVVIVAIIAWFLFAGSDVDNAGGADDNVNVTVEGTENAAEDTAESVEGASESTADAVGDAAESAADSAGDAAEATGDAASDAANEVEEETTTGN